MGQLEPKKILVESIPVEDRRKLSTNKGTLESLQGCTWEDLRGLSLIHSEEWFG